MPTHHFSGHTLPPPTRVISDAAGRVARRFQPRPRPGNAFGRNKLTYSESRATLVQNIHE